MTPAAEDIRRHTAAVIVARETYFAEQEAIRNRGPRPVACRGCEKPTRSVAGLCRSCQKGKP